MKAVHYVFGESARIAKGVDAQKVGEFLDELRKKHGLLTAELVEKAARSKRSPLYGAFEWNNDKAALQYRLEQARRLIRAVNVVYDEDPRPAFVHVSSPDISYYQATEVAKTNPTEWRLVLDAAVRYLKSASDKLERLQKISSKEKAAGVLKAAGLISKAHGVLESYEDEEEAA